jgi:hypothetical protein
MAGTEDVIAEPLVLLLELPDQRLWVAHQRQPIVQVVSYGMLPPSSRLFVASTPPYHLELCLNSHWLPPSCLLRGHALEHLFVDLLEACGLFLSV